MAKASEPKKFDVLSTEDVADLLLVKDRTIRNWVNYRGMPSTRDERGRRFSWSEVLPWYVKMRAEEDGNERKSPLPPVVDPDNPLTQPDLEAEAEREAEYERDRQLLQKSREAAARKVIAEAELKELELAERRRQVVAIEDAARTMQEAAKNLQKEILAWPTLMVDRVFAQRDRNQLFTLLTKSAHKLCTDLADLGGKRSDG